MLNEYKQGGSHKNAKLKTTAELRDNESRPLGGLCQARLWGDWVRLPPMQLCYQKGPNMTIL